MTAGMLTASRGVGTLLTMIVFGRLLAHLDVRLVIAIGFAITAISLWQMSGFYLQMDSSLIAWSGLMQGIGTGLVYVPLATITFATLLPQFRNEGTAVFSLLRNIGSSVGIAAVQALFIRNAQVMHSRLAEHVTPYGTQWPGSTDIHTATGLASINGQITAQSMMISYNNDFALMMWLSLACIPLVFLFRKASAQPGATPVVAE